jgi:hypothetical protein
VAARISQPSSPSVNVITSGNEGEKGAGGADESAYRLALGLGEGEPVFALDEKDDTAAFSVFQTLLGNLLEEGTTSKRSFKS